ncbi:MAG: hypothetical protein ACM30G_00290 [Micromonosporaceae bacterium]
MSNRGTTWRDEQSGWLSFAGILAIMLGIFNIIDGLITLFNDKYAVLTQGQVLLFDLTGWGWFLLILGVIQLIVGGGVLFGQSWARWTGVVIAGLVALLHLVLIVWAPFWSLVTISLCVLVIYALVVPPRTATG